jgi:recombination protein RecA
MSYEAFLSSLDPKTAAEVRTAAETEIVRYPLASRRITVSLGGGIAAGRIATIFGNESAGKSLLAVQTIGMLQKKGLVCGYLDAEGTYDKAYGAKLGVNNAELLHEVAKPFRRAEEKFLPWIQGGIDVLLIDTVSALIPDDFMDMDEKNGDDHINLEKRKKMMAHAKSTANMLRAIHMENEKTAVIILSQTTTSVQQTYVEQIPHGGKRLSFDSSQIIRLTSSPSEGNQIKGELQFGANLIQKPIGREVNWLVKKNKLGRSMDTGKYDMYYAEGTISDAKKKIGIDRDQELIMMCTDYGVIDGSSKGWYAYGGQKLREKELVRMIQQEEGFEKELETELDLAIAGGELDE